MITSGHLHRLLPTALLLMTLTAGCVTSYPEPPPTTPPRSSLPAPLPPTVTLPEPQPKPEIPSTMPPPGPAAALFKDAETALQSGQPARAEALLERAIRIEPRNPGYWHALARSAFHQGKYEQTIQFCLKSESLSGTGSPLTERNKQLLDRARTLMQTR